MGLRLTGFISRLACNQRLFLHGDTGGGGAHENPIQRLGIVRRSQHTRILHMALEIPKLLEPDAADIDDVIRRDDRRLRVRSAQRRAHRKSSLSPATDPLKAARPVKFSL